MRELTDEIKASLKAQWGDGALRFVSSTIETDEGEETLAIVVRKPSLEDFDAVVDAGATPKEAFESVSNCVIKYVVWPTPSEIGLVLDGDPTLVQLAWAQMEKLTGMDAKDAMRPGGFATLTDAEKQGAGITDEQIATWKAMDKRRVCVVFRTPLGLWICRRPGQSEYASYRRMRDTGKISAALRGLVAECGIYPNEDARAAQLEQLPVLAVHAGMHLAEMTEKKKSASGGI